MSLQIFEHNHRGAFLIRTHNSAESAVDTMLLHVFPFQDSAASIFEETFAFVRARDCLFGAVYA